MKIEDLLSTGGLAAGINPQVHTLDRIASPEGVRRVFCLSPTKALQNNSENDTTALGPASYTSSAPTRMFCLSPKNIMPVAAAIPTVSTEKLLGTTNCTESCSPSEKENSPAEEKHHISTQPPNNTNNKSTIRRYVHSKATPSKNLKTGRWSKLEHQKFLEGMDNFPKQWKRVADLIGTRTVLQVRTHAQKFFQSTKMAGNNNLNETSSKPTKRARSSSFSKPKVQKRAKPAVHAYSYHMPASNAQQDPGVGYTAPYTYSPVRSNDDRPWTTVASSVVVSACRSNMDGCHSRSSVDAVSALLSLGATS